METTTFVTPFLLFATTLLLGLRHGIDWDHIAAITDITTSTDNKRQSFWLGTVYVLGHALIIVLFGLLAVNLGVTLPDWVDALMEPFVGFTLLFLGVYLAFSIVRHGRNVHLQSRWMVIFKAASKIYDFVEHKITHKHKHSHFSYPQEFGVKTALIVGVVHGIGAETPTQLLLFIAATGAGGKVMGSFLVLTFVLGLVISNSIITLISLLGIAKAKQGSILYVFLAGVTAVFSIILGSIFVFGKGGILPSILGV